jgi:hypothetical protein
MITNALHLDSLLSSSSGTYKDQPAVFALLSLGIVESIANGLLSPTDALRIFFHAENCLFVRKRLRHKAADEIMSRGVQLPDLFEALPVEEAQREFQRELSILRALCLKLVEGKRKVA